ncbi:helix-turn-helix domain-containing protein [Bordetella bronchiseptica]|uniref:helix-turn-helix domain-containing protein n=1 Tax=Bordetella bronchiseptica TaxID=518 RepID=UPI001268ACE7|nr:helix-turn-helix domain-containing protein [Bordetella bronchiseptica]
MKTLAERISFAMAKAGVSQADLVRATKAKSSSVSNWVNGRTKNLKGANLAITAQLLSVSEAWLGAGIGPMERRPQIWPFKTIPPERYAEATEVQRAAIEEWVRDQLDRFLGPDPAEEPRDVANL